MKKCQFTIHDSQLKNRASCIVHRAFVCALCIVLYALCIVQTSAQSSWTFELKTSPTLDFTFNSMEKYRTGIIIPHALELKVNVVGVEWDLYVGATTTAAGDFNIVSSYSSVGTLPVPVSVVQARVYNARNTEQTGPSFFPLTDIATPTYIIGSAANDLSVNCADAVPVGTNQPGSYTSDPGCFRFNVDLKINPGLIYRPGMYNLRVDFIIIEDL